MTWLLCILVRTTISCRLEGAHLLYRRVSLSSPGPVFKLELYLQRDVYGWNVIRFKNGKSAFAPEQYMMAGKQFYRMSFLQFVVTSYARDFGLPPGTCAHVKHGSAFYLGDKSLIRVYMARTRLTKEKETQQAARRPMLTLKTGWARLVPQVFCSIMLTRQALEAM